MDSTRRIPLWAWWVVGPAVIVGIAAGVVIAVSNPAPLLPPGLVEKREAVSRLLEEQKHLEDTDIKPLVELEAKKDYRGASALMEKALAANAEHERLAGDLAAVSGELARLAIAVRPDAVGAKAVSAFQSLVELARAEKKFYASRRQLYEVTRNYYADLEAKKAPPVPDGLAGLVEAVNADLEKARELNRQFAAAVQAFDEAVAGK